jgi:NAD(P)H-dependent FMN reductase
MPTLDVIVGSTRPGRAGPAVADWFVASAKDHGGFDVNLVDLAEVALPLLDEPRHPMQRRYRHQHTAGWSATVAAADAFVFVTPEYNTGPPAALKNALDFLYWEWAYKPVGMVGYGMGAAGANAVQMIKPIAVALRMVPLPAAVAVPLRDCLDDHGTLRPSAAMESAVGPMLDELLRLTRALAGLRAPADSGVRP